MNNSPDRVFEDILRLLRDDVIPQLEGDALRSQVFGAIFMLKNLQLRVDWGGAPLIDEIRAQDTLFDALRALDPPVDVELPKAPRLAPGTPTGGRLLALRDEGNALVSRFIAEGGGRRAGDPVRVAMDALLSAYMRTELELEIRHTPKPMFAEMSSGKAQGG